MNFKNEVSPSLLAADYGYLADAAKKAENGGASSLHLDYMDGHYVPNISFGFQLIPALKNIVNIPLISHLMISNAEDRLKDFIKNGPDYIVIQEDAVNDAMKTIEDIKKAGIKTGVAINPDRALKNIYNLLFHIDYLLILSVYPGFGGQSFIEDTLFKMEEAHNFRIKNNLSFDIAVDGGVNLKTAKKILETGVNVLVAGSAVYGKKDIKKAIEDLLNINNAYSPDK